MRVAVWTAATATILMWAGGAVRVEAAAGRCAKTPAAALLRVSEEAAGGEAAAGGEVAELEAMHGFRVETVRWDPFLGHGWAVIQSCEHRERPSFTVRTEFATPLVSRRADRVVRAEVVLAIVRTGDLVRFWRRENNAQIEMIATSEESGVVGTRVRVKLSTPRDADGQPGQPLYLAGVVRGPADVEMVQ
jgi:hypothetical protein